MNDNKAYVIATCAAAAMFVGIAFAAAWQGRAKYEQPDLDAGQPDPPQMTGRAPHFSSSPAAGVQPSSGQVQAQPSASPSESSSGGDAVQLGIPGVLDTDLTGFTYSLYEDSFLATEEGLFDMTVSLWSTPEFLELTQDEAHELLALDDTMGMKGPDSMLSIVGPLPDREACRLAFASQSVQDALWDVVKLEVLLVELGEIPADRRPRWARQRVEEAINMRDAAMLDLMELCEKETGINTWRIWFRMYRRWSTKGMVPSEDK